MCIAFEGGGSLTASEAYAYAEERHTQGSFKTIRFPIP